MPIPITIRNAIERVWNEAESSPDGQWNMRIIVGGKEYKVHLTFRDPDRPKNLATIRIVSRERLEEP